MYEEDFDYVEDQYDAGTDCGCSGKTVGKVFYRWKDAIDHIWVEMTGKEFFDFIKSDEGKKHFFIEEVDPYFEADTIVHEATETDYRRWKSEKVRYFQLRSDIKIQAGDMPPEEKNHRRKPPAIYSIVSFNQKGENDDDDAPTSLEEIAMDPDSSFEDELLTKMTVQEMMKVLSPEEKEVINALFFDNPDNLSERHVAQIIGVSQKKFNRRKNRALKKLKKFLK